MDIVTYALAKKMVSSVASGITEVQTDGTNIRFKTASGDWFTVTLNSISEVSVSANGHLIVKLSDGTQLDCGALPVGTMDSSLSTISENGVQNKVITNALNGKQNTLVQGSGITIDTTDPTHPQISANIDYTNLINKPTKLSDFTNDENFITNTVNNLSNYYLKTETYTQSEVNNLISQLTALSIKIVEELPTTDISTTTIYLINVSGTNNYNQWMYINNAWANLGSTSVDLTNYYTKGQTDTLLDSKVDKVIGKGLSTNDFTNAYKSVLDSYTVDSVLDSSSTNPIQNGTVTDALNTKQPKTLSSPITIGGVTSATVESALGNLNSLCGTKLTMVTSLPLSPSNQETVLYIGNSSGGLLCGGIYQYQVSEWVMISNVSSFTFNSDEFAVDSTTNKVSLKPSYADIPSFLPNNVSSSNKLVTTDGIFRVGDRRNTIGWADLSNDVNIDGSSNYANNVGRIEGHNALIEVSNPSTGYQWPVTNSGDNNTFIDFGGAIQFFTDKVNNRLYVRFADSVDMSAWREIATMDKVPEVVINPTELDTNKFLKSGYYSLGDASNRTNLPALEACTLLVFNAGWYIIQEILTNVSNGMYYRRSLDNGSTWNAWTKVSTT